MVSRIKRPILSFLLRDGGERRRIKGCYCLLLLIQCAELSSRFKLQGSYGCPARGALSGTPFLRMSKYYAVAGPPSASVLLTVIHNSAHAHARAFETISHRLLARSLGGAPRFLGEVP